MKIKTFEDNVFVTYECKTPEELTNVKEMWKRRFRKNNNTDKAILQCGSDKSYDSFCLELDKIVFLDDPILEPIRC